jgi:hypothetical protein
MDFEHRLEERLNAIFEEQMQFKFEPGNMTPEQKFLWSLKDLKVEGHRDIVTTANYRSDRENEDWDEVPGIIYSVTGTVFIPQELVDMYQEPDAATLFKNTIDADYLRDEAKLNVPSIQDSVEGWTIDQFAPVEGQPGVYGIALSISEADQPSEQI